MSEAMAQRVEPQDDKWWLISETTLRRVRDVLERQVELIDGHCAETGCLCDLAKGPICSQPLTDLLHDVDSGAHTTREIPDDFK